MSTLANMEPEEAVQQSGNAPKIFISWSGPRSGALALALDDWIETTLQGAECYVSSNDVKAGDRWLNEVGEALSRYDHGIICVTSENVASPWLLFEAGALSRNVDTARVIPVVLDFPPGDLQQPLSQFQGVQANEAGIKSLLHSLAAGLPVKVDKVFNAFWQDLEGKIEETLAMPGEQPPPQVDAQSMLQEIMSMLRGMDNALGNAVPEPPSTVRGRKAELLRKRLHWAIHEGDLNSAESIMKELAILEALVRESSVPTANEPEPGRVRFGGTSETGS